MTATAKKGISRHVHSAHGEAGRSSRRTRAPRPAGCGRFSVHGWQGSARQSAPPRVFAHLPIGVGAGTDDQGLSRFLEAIPQSVTVLACKPSWDGQALVLRLQESCGARAELCDPCDRGASPFSFRPFEIKTLRLERSGALREVDLIGETAPHWVRGTKVAKPRNPAAPN